MEDKFTWDFLFDADDNTAFRNNYTIEDMEERAEKEDYNKEPKTIIEVLRKKKKLEGYGGGFIARHYPERL